MFCSPKTTVAVALTLALLPSATLRAEDWPQWRGLNRDGVCGETGLLESFPAEGLKVRWRVPVGWGFSSPVVAQGHVYLADSEVVKPQAKERLHCFDETTGKALWTHAYDVAYEDWAFDPKQEIGPVATQASEGGLEGAFVDHLLVAIVLERLIVLLDRLVRRLDESVGHARRADSAQRSWEGLCLLAHSSARERSRNPARADTLS